MNKSELAELVVGPLYNPHIYASFDNMPFFVIWSAIVRRRGMKMSRKFLLSLKEERVTVSPSAQRTPLSMEVPMEEVEPTPICSKASYTNP